MTYPPPPGTPPDPVPYGQPPENDFPPAGGMPPNVAPPGFPPSGAPQRPAGRGGTIGWIVVAVVVALIVCVGGVVTTIAVLVTNDDEPQEATASTGSAPAQAAPLDCRPVTRSDGKAVGQPDFHGAARTGTATMALTTNLGVLSIVMDRTKVPCTVASFEYLAGKRFFDNTPCHRLTAESIYVLQCGDPTGTGTGGPDYQFSDENLTGAKYGRGVVAMANAGPNTNGSQFFIVYRDSEISPSYTVFGKVNTGLAVVDQVAEAGVDPSGGSPSDGPPKLAVTVQSVTVE